MESEGEGREREEEEEGAYKGIPVTLTMVQKWVDKITTVTIHTPLIYIIYTSYNEDH